MNVDPQVAERVTVITNGNVFSLIGLSSLMARHETGLVLQVVVTSGMRKQRGNRIVEAMGLLRRWGLRYFGYKTATLLVPSVVQRFDRRPLSVVRACRHHGIPVVKARNVNSGPVRDAIAEFSPDIILSFSCPYRIGKKLLDIPRIGCLNVHSSLLPAYAGVCTYVHVLADGLSETGITIHEMVERFDAGGILHQERVPIVPGSSVLDLFSRQCQVIGSVLPEVLIKCIRDRRIDGHHQDLSKRSYCGEPNQSDIRRLRDNGHCLARWHDWKNLFSCISDGKQ